MAICLRHKNVAPEVTSTGNNLCIINRTVTPPFGDRKSNWLWPPLWENTLCPIQQDILNRCPHELFLETSRKNRTIKHQYAYLTLTLDCENELLERLKLLHDCWTQAAKLLTYTPNLVANFFTLVAKVETFTVTSRSAGFTYYLIIHGFWLVITLILIFQSISAV